MFGNTKSPEALVTTGAEAVPRVSLVRVIVAPGITPPCASLTVPAIVPVTPCANTEAATARDAVNTVASRRTRRKASILNPPVQTTSAARAQGSGAHANTRGRRDQWCYGGGTVTCRGGNSRPSATG